MKTTTKKRLKVTAIIILILFALITRFFAMSVLGEPFFGETLSSIFSKKEKEVSIDEQGLSKLKTLIHPIQSTTKVDTTELSFLDEKIKNAEVIGLGEATHGTKEFFELKAKLFKYLVEKHNIKLFGIEANFGACYDINKYVIYGEGNAKEALSKNGYWVWQSQEVLDLIEWMKNYNVGKPKESQIQFYGYDMQNASAEIEWLEKYLTKSIPNFSKELLPEKFDTSADKLRKLNDKELNNLKKYNLDKLNKLIDFVTKQENSLKSQNQFDYQFAQQSMNIIGQKLHYFRVTDFNTAYNYRDSSMAQNVKWIKDINNNAKIFLWAHNGHIGKGSFSDDFKSGNWMGTHLKDIYKDKYYNIGFSFNEGGFVAQSPSSTNVFYLMYSFIKSIFKDEPWLVLENFVKPHSKSYLTNTFSKLATPIFFIDFKEVSNDKKLKEFVNKEYEHYEAGAVYINEKSALWTTNLYELFDGIIYIDKTNPAKNFNIGEYAK